MKGQAAPIRYRVIAWRDQHKPVCRKRIGFELAEIHDIGDDSNFDEPFRHGPDNAVA